MSSPSLALIDDDKLVLTTLGKGLRNAGFDLLEYNSGNEALDSFSNNHPDLAIIDIMMPEIDGIQLGKRLTELGIPFIILSAYSDEEYVASALNLGAITYMVKPVDVNQLVPVIKTAVKRSQDIQNLREKEQNLEKALDSDRSASIAIGILMERYGIKRDDAFETLRRSARTQRRKFVDICKELVTNVEILEFPANFKTPKSED